MAKPKRRIWMLTARLEKGLTQKELARRVGVSNKTISQIELGNLLPSGQLAYKIAKELGVDMSLFYETEVS